MAPTPALDDSFSPDYNDFIFMLNMSKDELRYRSSNILIPAYSYTIGYGRVTDDFYQFPFSRSTNKAKAEITSNSGGDPTGWGYVTSDNNFFVMTFRKGDGAAGCFYDWPAYYDTPDIPFDVRRQWDACAAMDSSNNYAEIKIKVGTQAKKIRINKITGQTEVCLCDNADTCGTCTTI
jgi:hypothetical protein